MALLLPKKLFPKFLNSHYCYQYIKFSSTSGLNKDAVLKSLDTEEDARNRIRESTIKLEAPVDVKLISGVPEEHTCYRTAKIYKPPKNALQSGTAHTHHWQIMFDTRERWKNPLMGWCSSGDPLSNLKITFCNKDDAVQFCEKKWVGMVRPTEVP
ncbi:hypothetical protein NQ317_011709 [Molorchus minor]|uniref:NADH dehydrogenase [ubiquinone] iron-sulfur protein 4, mitochondrial n=1 Tax=Molorchus minor TaxID=1323400 RepID=A0ABQ9JSR6_9CUCU|nr:hypothetical protein NQ317_011709 [Molorchus minor]